MAIKVIKGNSPALSLLRTLRRGLEMVVVWAVGKDMLACGEACKLWGVCDRLEQGRQDRREYSSFKNDVENCVYSIMLRYPFSAASWRQALPLHLLLPHQYSEQNQDLHSGRSRLRSQSRDGVIALQS